MIILGIDPGTTRIGYGLIKKERNVLTPVYYGLISQPSPSLVMSELNEIIKKYKPGLAAVEKLFFFKNQKTIIAVSEMRGVIMASLAMNNVPTEEFTPLQVKQAVSGYGRAGKVQVEQMVRLILNIKEVIKPDDIADGLAIAICCANNIVYRK